jgi:hypothetical protein
MNLFDFLKRDGRITLLVTALVLAACTEGGEKKKDPKKTGAQGAEVQQGNGTGVETAKGAFALTVPEEASGLLDVLVIKVLDQNGNVVSDQKIEVKGGESLSFPLDVGSYKVTVEAFLKEVLMFTGSGATEIKVGEKSLLDVTMVAAEGAQAAGQGELEIRLKLPGMGDAAGGDEADDQAEDQGPAGGDPDQGQDQDGAEADEDQGGQEGQEGQDGQDGQDAGQDDDGQDEAGPDQGDDGAAADDGADDAVVKSIVGEWKTDYSLLGATYVLIKADAAGKMVISDDSGKPAITVDYKFADGVLFISNMKTEDELRHLARTVKKNIGRSIDVTKGKNGALDAEILLPSGFIRTKSFVKAD